MSVSSSVTLRDLARRLDVAPSTISRALADGSGVGPDRVHQIRELAKSLNYRPRAMRRNRADAVALLIATDHGDIPDDSFEYATVFHISRAVADIGWHVYVDLVDRDSSGQALPPLLQDNRVDGAIVSGCFPRRFYDLLRKAQIPAVAVQDLAERTGCPSVIPDVAPATESAVSRLIEMGHRRIAYVAMPADMPAVQRRNDGYRRALKSAGIELDPRLQVLVTHSVLQQGHAAVRQLLAQDARPTAIVFVTDRLAIGGICELARAGLRVPEDVSVIGHDNSSMADESDPPLTSVEMGFAETATMALQLLRGNRETHWSELPQEEIRCRVIWRASCGPVPAQRRSSHS